jgi:surfactin synthase thioesterase subunit
VVPPLDLHGELQARGEQEFRHWLREQPADALRASIRAHDLDPSRRTAKWKEAEKLADFIADALQARLARGSAFLGRWSGA